MKSLFSFASLAIACIVAGNAQAGLVNGDFEGSTGTVSAEGGASPGANPSDWTLFEDGGIWNVFQFNPTDSEYADTTDSGTSAGIGANMDGTTIVSMGAAASLAQISSQAFVVGETCTLTVAIGFKSANSTNYSLQITNGSGTALATATGAITGDGGLLNYSVSYTATGAVGETGNVGVKITQTGGSMAIDNARLTHVPEPTSFALAGLSLVGLIGSVRRRRRNRA